MALGTRGRRTEGAGRSLRRGHGEQTPAPGPGRTTRRARRRVRGVIDHGPVRSVGNGRTEPPRRPAPLTDVRSGVTWKRRAMRLLMAGRLPQSCPQGANTSSVRKQVLNRLASRVNSRERQRHLGVDHGVDHQRVKASLRTHLGDGPVRPLRVVLQYVHEDVGVHQQHQSSERSSCATNVARLRQPPGGDQTLRPGG